MKRNSRSLRIIKRKTEHGNPKDYSKVELFTFENKVVAIIDDNTIIYNGKVIKNEQKKV